MTFQNLTTGTIIMVLFTTYAITRYRLMDIRVVIRKGTIFLLTFSVLLLVFSALSWGMFRAFGLNFSQEIFVLSVFSFVVALALYYPVKSFFIGLANKYFFASLYDEEKILRELIRQIPTILDLEELVHVIAHKLKKSLQIESVSIWSVDLEKDKIKPLLLSGCSLKDKNKIVKNKIILDYFAEYKEPLVLQEVDYIMGRMCKIGSKRECQKLRSEIDKVGIEIILPLIIKNRLVGLICLGRKIDGAAYTQEDIKMLEIIANQAAGALENASLYEETQKFGERLQKEVKRATAKLRRINKQLMKLDQAKSEFLSIASHQLRTPLTAIKGYVSMILEGDFGKVNKNLDEPLKRTFSSTQRMVNLVENLLNISRIESGRIAFDFKKVDLVQLVKSIINELYPAASKKGLKMVCNCDKAPLEIIADEAKMKEVVSNLVDNAIKYTEKGTVTISLKEEKKNGKKFVLLSVADTGMGIAEEDLPGVFQKFRRGRRSSLVHTEGLGLGMYFAQKMVEAHRGKIWVESKGVGKGSTFYIRLPVKLDIKKAGLKKRKSVGGSK